MTINNIVLRQILSGNYKTKNIVRSFAKNTALSKDRNRAEHFKCSARNFHMDLCCGEAVIGRVVCKWMRDSGI